MIRLTLNVRKKLVTDLRKHRPNVFRVLFPSNERKAQTFSAASALSASMDVALRLIK